MRIVAPRDLLRALLTALTVCALPGASARVYGQAAVPPDAVFQLLTVARQPEDGQYVSAGYGTGFFIAPDGTALTVSHVVYLAQHDPAHYQLLAIVGKEFYSVAIVCASGLPYDPTNPPKDGVTPSRDVAQIRIVSPTTPFQTWAFKLDNGIVYPLASRHDGPLPEFPALSLGPNPGPGDRIRIIGFGRISPIPKKWTAGGVVGETWTLRDGAPAFSATLQSQPQPGGSGSPVLNAKNQVVGIWPWVDASRSDGGAGISSSALTPACP